MLERLTVELRCLPYLLYGEDPFIQIKVTLATNYICPAFVSVTYYSNCVVRYTIWHFQAVVINLQAFPLGLASQWVNHPYFITFRVPSRPHIDAAMYEYFVPECKTNGLCPTTRHQTRKFKFGPVLQQILRCLTQMDLLKVHLVTDRVHPSLF